jgi:hypothetical protein
LCPDFGNGDIANVFPNVSYDERACASDSIEKMYPELESHVFGPIKIRPFGEDDKFRSFQYRLQQITHVVKFFEEYHQADPSNDSLTRAFDDNLTVPTPAPKHDYTVPNVQVKADLFVLAEEEVIIQWIRLNSQKQGTQLGRKSEVTRLKHSKSLFREDESVYLHQGTKKNSGKHGPNRKKNPGFGFRASFLCAP